MPWSLDDINWHEFDPGKAPPELVALIKAASLVEYNSHEYARYLCEVFHDDPDFKQAALKWATEEIQHGRALRKWAECADPDFDFDKSFARFANEIKLPAGRDTSIRGTRSGELISRCVVETGTSLYYTAIKDYVQEPVLKSICAKIAADELRHYKMFYDFLKIYLVKERLGFFRRFLAALSRITECEDDELAFAFFAANNDNCAYDRKLYNDLCKINVYRFYRKDHVERMTVMVLKAVGLKTNGLASRAVNQLAWKFMNLRARAKLPAAPRQAA